MQKWFCGILETDIFLLFQHDISEEQLKSVEISPNKAI